MNAPEIISHPASDGYPMAVRVWKPLHAIGRVIVVHGIVSHGGWYLRSCRYLADRNLEVHALDRRGSGLNFRQRGDVANVNRWLEDVEEYINSLSPRLPTVLLGISWGGKLAALLSTRDKTLLAGIGLICPGIFAYQQANFMQQILLRVAASSGLSKRLVRIPLHDPELFTDHPDYKAYICDDPFTLRQITIRFAKADLQLNKLARASAKMIRLPIFLMLAGREKIVSNDRTLRFWEQVKSTQKNLIQYHAAAHTLEFEADPSKYLTDLYAQVLNILDGVNGEEF